MSLEWWFKFFERSGPYSTPLAVATFGALVWVVWDRSRILKALNEANADRIAIRDLRTQDLERSTREFTKQAVILGEVVRDFVSLRDRLLEKLK